MKRSPYRTAPPPGTLADLVRLFRASPTSRAWSPVTARPYELILDALVRENGKMPARSVRRGHIVAMRDEFAETPSMGNKWLKVVKMLFAYGVEIEMIEASPAATVPRLKLPNPDGHRTWRDDEIDAYLAKHPLGTLPHLVMTLALCTAAARVDLCALGWGNIAGDRIRYRRRKTRGQQAPLIDLPILPELAEALAHVPATRLTFLETAHGRTRSEKGLGGDFAQWVAEAGLADRDDLGRTLSLHGLRKAVARRMAEGGATPQEIMSVLGHKSVAMAAHYSAAYDRARSADSGFEKMGKAAETNVVRIRRKE